MNEPALKAPGVTSHIGARNHDRSLAEIVNEIKDEVKSFVSTRIRMMNSEFHESLGAVKVGLPLAILALGLLAIAALLFTAALVVLVASAFAGNPYAWFFAFVIVGFIWTAGGAIAGYFAFTQFRGLFPKRTMEVLKADKLWLQTEVRSHP